MNANRGAMSTPAGLPSLAGLLRALRERALLTQEELAQRAGLSVGTVRGLESGRSRRPRCATVRLLAEVLARTEPEWQAIVAAARVRRPAGPGDPTEPMAGAGQAVEFRVLGSPIRGTDLRLAHVATDSLDGDWAPAPRTAVSRLVPEQTRAFDG